ncbi:putative pentatricopeptide repeat-containing protein-like isoform X1 [Capsicum annuum]|uniref:uncharacterized protein LOC107877806 n=1 Tax=Capsicum annuum TaxID=4072 RepID=UPI001FB07E1E|nr:uncharacterized protein LOC107877806 [Capsicum annuum]KAF3615311.1 putative pentatricopeptide repeat-containing protein-like isoform X1 [Capsicum annuum]
MKGGLKVPRISLILVGFVCATVITFAYVKSPFLSYWTPSQDHVFQISPDFKVKDEEVLRERNRVEKSEENMKFKSAISNSFMKDNVTEELITNTEIEGNAGIPAKVPQKGEDLKALELKNSSRDQENEVTAPVNSAGGAAENMISTLKNHGDYHSI